MKKQKSPGRTEYCKCEGEHRQGAIWLFGCVRKASHGGRVEGATEGCAIAGRQAGRQAGKQALAQFRCAATTPSPPSPA